MFNPKVRFPKISDVIFGDEKYWEKNEHYGVIAERDKLIVFQSINSWNDNINLIDVHNGSKMPSDLEIKSILLGIMLPFEIDWLLTREVKGYTPKLLNFRRFLISGEYEDEPPKIESDSVTLAPLRYFIKE